MGGRRDARLRAPIRSNEPENVVVLLRPQREAASSAAPAVALTNSERPAPAHSSPNDGRAWLFFLLLASLLLHGGLLVLFRQEPEPYSSIGIPAISVEIVLGADAPAGVAQTPSPNETQEIAPVEKQKETVETPPVTESKPDARETPVQQADAQPATDEPPTIEAESVPIQPESERPDAKAVPLPAKPQPIQEPKETKRPAQEAKQQQPANRKAQAASGVGQGRSTADANYHGLVAAHLARHKQYPAEARAQRAEGTASVAFAIDGSGRVTSARLARTSGVPALDQESVAMVRRASPFPAPPDGRPMSFTVPVSFDIR